MFLFQQDTFSKLESKDVFIFTSNSYLEIALAIHIPISNVWESLFTHVLDNMGCYQSLIFANLMGEYGINCCFSLHFPNYKWSVFSNVYQEFEFSRL